MNDAHRKITLTLANKIDILMWALAVPLIPMIIAELFGSLSIQTVAYFGAYYAVLWVVFTLEFILRVSLEKNKMAYMKTHWFDVLVVLTPAFKTLKAFEFVRFSVVLLSDRALVALTSFRWNFLYYLMFGAVVVIGGAHLTLFFESQNPGSQIRTIEEAGWWALNTLSSGSAQTYPVTFGGKIIAIALMTIGFAIFSILIAFMISFFMKEYGKKKPEEKDFFKGIADELGIDDIVLRLERIEKKLDK